MLEEQNPSLIQGKGLIFTIAAINIFHDAVIKTAITYDHAMWNTHQLSIGKLGAWPHVFTIIQQYFHAFLR